MLLVLLEDWPELSESYGLTGGVSVGVNLPHPRATSSGKTQAVRRPVYPDSSDRLNDSRVRVRSLLANSVATGFINRIRPKSSPSAV